MSKATVTAMAWLTFVGVTMTGYTHADDAGEVTAPRHSDHAGLIPAEYPSPPGLTEGWLEPWRHIHFSRRGTPFAHPVTVLPIQSSCEAAIRYRSVAAVRKNRPPAMRDVGTERRWQMFG